MPRVVRCALIQASVPAVEGSPLEQKEAMIRKHLPLIEEAGKKGARITDRRPEMYGEIGQQLP